MLRRTFLMLTTSLAMACTVSQANAACSPDYSGVTLTVATQTGPYIASALKLGADEWAKKTCGKVNVVEFPFGELYTRDVIDLKTRELCTVAALTVQGFSLPELKLHIKAALRCGASRAQVAEIITQMIAYCGFPAATNALMTMKEAFDEVDAPGRSKKRKTPPRPKRK